MGCRYTPSVQSKWNKRKVFTSHRYFEVIGDSTRLIGPLNVMDGTKGMPNINVNDITNDDGRHLFAQAYIVFSSRRTNPSGRGKVGWSTGAKISNAFMSRSNLIVNSIAKDNKSYIVSWNEDPKYKIPYRIWAGIEYDLRRDLKFLALAWIDNGYKTMNFDSIRRDYLGTDGSTIFN